jgi:[ribosomal protein S18]-alanine N-acetyltransferase
MPSLPTIRPMTESDLPQVLAVERLCHAHPWSEPLLRQELAEGTARSALLWQGQELAGYICARLLLGELEILNVATAPAFRRRGVAATLLRHLLAEARQQGMERAFLEVRVGNEPAQALYRSFGFRPCGVRRHYYTDGEDALLMAYREE